MGQEIGDNVNAKISENMLQRRAANLLKITFEGYWTAMGVQSEGRIDALRTGDQVLIAPSTEDEIKNSPTTDIGQISGLGSETIKAGNRFDELVGSQREREPFIEWSELPAALEQDKMVQIVADGGARPNPGPAGWGALIRQNGRCTWNWG
jgi:hypothetical protein